MKNTPNKKKNRKLNIKPDSDIKVQKMKPQVSYKQVLMEKFESNDISKEFKIFNEFEEYCRVDTGKNQYNSNQHSQRDASKFKLKKVSQKLENNRYYQDPKEPPQKKDGVLSNRREIRQSELKRWQSPLLSNYENEIATSSRINITVEMDKHSQGCSPMPPRPDT